MEGAIVNGLVGGLIATIVMSVFMMAMGGDEPPPTAAFWAKYVGDGAPAEYQMVGMVLHLVYGTAAGGVFGLTLYVVDVGIGDVVIGVAAGLGYGVVLFLGAAMFWMRIVLDMDPEPKQVGAFLLFHLIYGLVLGGWMGLAVLTF